MIKVLFVCLGNICRSPMAEFILKDIVNKEGLQDQFVIESAGTSSEEVGNNIHRGTVKVLMKNNIPFENRIARQITKEDYDKYNFILVMEQDNIHEISHIIKGDPQSKIYRLLDFSSSHKDIADPWYTGDFELAYDEISKGCDSFFKFIKRNYII